MDRLNQSFQDMLARHGFQMKVTPADTEVTYQSRLALAEDDLIDFAILVPRADSREVVQMVFDNIQVCQDHDQRQRCLAILNNINLTSGLYYYLSMREDGTVFARYMLPLDPDRPDVVMDLIQVGSHLMKQVRSVLLANIAP